MQTHDAADSRASWYATPCSNAPTVPVPAVPVIGHWTFGLRVSMISVVHPAPSSFRTGAFMAKKKKVPLKVQTDGKRHFISVPANLAQNLHAYLRGHRVRSSPPEPAYTGFDAIELAADLDVPAVQALLNAW